jgi:hypothetical protein
MFHVFTVYPQGVKKAEGFIYTCAYCGEGANDFPRYPLVPSQCPVQVAKEG